MTQSMVERVAEVLERHCGCHEPLRSQMARAAIDAMREPMPQMVVKGCDDYIHNDYDVSVIWKLMIDEALRDG